MSPVGITQPSRKHYHTKAGWGRKLIIAVHNSGFLEAGIGFKTDGVTASGGTGYTIRMNQTVKAKYPHATFISSLCASGWFHPRI